MKTWSLRTRLTLWSALVTSAALLTLGLGTAVGLYFNQRGLLDEQLRGDARIFFSELHEHGTPSDADAAEAERLLDDSGRPLVGLAFGPLDGPATHVSPAAFARTAARLPPGNGFATVPFDGLPRRIGVFTDGPFKLVLAADLQPARRLVFDLLAACALALPIVLVVVGLGSGWIARRALEPIARITAAASAITAENLRARLPEPATDDEIGRHTRVLNAMFDRLDRSFEQASRFTADASHELRTPLTILRGEIEQALHAGPHHPAQEKILLSLLEQTDRLQRIAENLLLLARFDAGKQATDLAPLDLSALARDAVEDAGLLAASRQLQVSADIAPDLHVRGDPLLLQRLLLNLVDNAVRYNRPGGEVRLALKRHASHAVLSVANTGPGIPAARQAEVFQRFFRLTPDRSRVAGGSGLGLSLCREIALAHGGTIALVSNGHDLTEFTVRLPALAGPEETAHRAGAR